MDNNESRRPDTSELNLPLKKWCVDFDVQSDAVIAENTTRLTYKGTSFRVELTNLNALPGNPPYLMACQVFLDATTPQEAKELGTINLRLFLDMLSLATRSGYLIERIHMALEWEPDSPRRSGHVFKHFQNPNAPFAILDQALFDSVAVLLEKSIDPEVRQALRWFSKALNSESPSEQYVYFWLALEILSEFSKGSKRVADRCSKCGSELFCRACNDVPTHRPFARQAIDDVIRSAVGASIFPDAQTLCDIRNDLFHGKDIEQIESDRKVKMLDQIDGLCGVVWKSLLQSVIPKRDLDLALLAPVTIRRQGFGLTLNVQLVVSPSDANSPLAYRKVLNVDLAVSKSPDGSDPNNVSPL